jgi:hypothetical protein
MLFDPKHEQRCGELQKHVRQEQMVTPVHGEFVNYAAIGIWNRPRQWCRQA